MVCCQGLFPLEVTKNKQTTIRLIDDQDPISPTNFTLLSWSATLADRKVFPPPQTPRPFERESGASEAERG